MAAAKAKKHVKAGAKKQSAGKSRGKKTRSRRRDTGSGLPAPILGVTLVIDLSNPSLDHASILAKINDFISDQEIADALVCFGRHPFIP